MSSRLIGSDSRFSASCNRAISDFGDLFRLAKCCFFIYVVFYYTLILTVVPSLHNLPATPGSEVGRFAKLTCAPDADKLPWNAALAPLNINACVLPDAIVKSLAPFLINDP